MASEQASMALSVEGPIRFKIKYCSLREFDVTASLSKVSVDAQPHGQDARENPDVLDKDEAGPWESSAVVRRGIVCMFVHGRGPDDFVFILDSGASVHATARYYLLKDLTAVAPGESVRAANGKDLQVRGRGRVSLDLITLEDVDYIPGLTANIVSVSKLADLDYSVQFKGAGCFVRDDRAAGALVGSGRRHNNGVYVLDYLFVPSGRTAAAPQGPAAAH